jgi:hypothetical protein
LQVNTGRAGRIAVCEPSLRSIQRLAALRASRPPFSCTAKKPKTRYFHVIFSIKLFIVNSLKGVFTICKKLENAPFGDLQFH